MKVILDDETAGAGYYRVRVERDGELLIDADVSQSEYDKLAMKLIDVEEITEVLS